MWETLRIVVAQIVADGAAQIEIGGGAQLAAAEAIAPA